MKYLNFNINSMCRFFLSLNRRVDLDDHAVAEACFGFPPVLKLQICTDLLRTNTSLLQNNEIKENMGKKWVNTLQYFG